MTAPAKNKISVLLVDDHQVVRVGLRSLLTSSPTIEVVGLPDAEGPPPAAGLGDLTLGVTLVLGDDVRIRRRDADIQVAGSLRIQRTPPEPLHVDGTVEIVRGWYTFQGRRFTLRNGSVHFTGGKVGDAKLDLEAWRRSGDYDVTVALAGTLEDPVLLLSDRRIALFAVDKRPEGLTVPFEGGVKPGPAVLEVSKGYRPWPMVLLSR